MNWWERWPGLLERELNRFAELSIEVRQDMVEMANGRIVLDATLELEGSPTGLRVIYPDTFPDLRFAVYAPSLKLERHQAPFGGNLCVIARGSGNWRPTMMAADVIKERVPELVGLVRAGGAAMRAAEDPQGEPMTAFYAYTSQGGIIIPEEALHIPETETRGWFTVAFDGDPQWLGTRDRTAIGRGLLASVSDQKGRMLAQADVQLRRSFAGPIWRGAWLRFSSFVKAADARRFGPLLMPRLADSLRKTQNACGGGRAVISAATFPEEVRQGEAGAAWVFYVEVAEGPKRGGASATLVRGLRFSPSELAMRIPELKSLSGKTVSVLGAGALGAPIAMELARAQTKVLRLLDTDFVDPSAGVRWTQGLEGAGAAKVTALQKTIESNYPYTQVEPVHLRVGDASPNRLSTPEASALASFLDGAALVIEATADENVSRALADRATGLKVPQLFVWGIDGYGGVVARVVPGTTGCYHCLSLALSGGTISPPPASSAPDRLRVQPRGCADPTATFSYAELMPLVGQATRLAFSMLSEGVAGGYPRFGKDVFVLSLRNPDGTFLDAPTWQTHSLEINPQCPYCNSSAARSKPVSESNAAFSR